MNDDKIKNLYDQLSEEYDLGQYEDFHSDIQDEEKRRKLYDAIKPDYDVPEYDEFNRLLGFSSDTPKMNYAAVRDKMKALRTPTSAVSTMADRPVTPPTATRPTATAHPATTSKATSTPRPISAQSVSDRIKGALANSPFAQGVNRKQQQLTEQAEAEAILAGRATSKEKDRQPYVNTSNVESPIQADLTPQGTASPIDLPSVRQADEAVRFQLPDVSNMSADELITTEQQLKANASDMFGFDRKQQAMWQSVYDSYQRMMGDEESRLRSQIATLEQHVNEKLNRQNSDTGILGALGRSKSTYGLSDEMLLASDPEVIALNEARGRLHTIEDAKAGGGYWRGFGRAITDPSLLTSGFTDLVKAGKMWEAQQKMEQADPEDTTQGLSDEERGMLEQIIMGGDTQARYKDDLGFLYTAGQISAEAMPFVAEFLATGGGFSAVSKGIENQVAKSIAKGISNKFARHLVKSLGAVAGDVTAASLMANTTGAMKTWSDVVGRHIGDAGFDENGQIQFSDGKSWGESLWQGQVSNILEYYTEMLGGRIEGSVYTKLLTDKLKSGGVAALEGLRAGNIVRGWNFLTDTQGYKAARKLLEMSGVSGYPGEVLEEEANIILNAGLVGDNKLSDLIDWNTQRDIVGGMFFSIGQMQALPLLMGTTSSIAEYGRLRDKLDRMDANAKTSLGDKWDALRNSIDGSRSEDFAAQATAIADDESLTTSQKRAATEYLTALMQMRGFNTGLIWNARRKVRNLENSREEVNGLMSNAYNQGYGAMEGGQTDPHSLQMQSDKATADLTAMGQQGQDVIDYIDRAIQNDESAENISAQIMTLPEPLQPKALAYLNSATALVGARDYANDEVQNRMTSVERQTAPYVYEGEDMEGTPQRVITSAATTDGQPIHLMNYDPASHIITVVDAEGNMQQVIRGSNNDNIDYSSVSTQSYDEYMQQQRNAVTSEVFAETQARLEHNGKTNVSMEVGSLVETTDGTMYVFANDGENVQLLPTQANVQTGQMEPVNTQPLTMGVAEAVAAQDAFHDAPAVEQAAVQDAEAAAQQPAEEPEQPSEEPEQPQDELPDITDAGAAVMAARQALIDNGLDAVAAAIDNGGQYNPKDLSSEEQALADAYQAALTAYQQAETDAEARQQAAAAAPEQPEQPATAIPTDEQGVKRYEQGVDVDAAIDDIEADGFPVDQVADLSIREAEAEQKKLKKKVDAGPQTRAELTDTRNENPTTDYGKALRRYNELQGTIDYYNALKARNTERQQATADAEAAEAARIAEEQAAAERAEELARQQAAAAETARRAAEEAERRRAGQIPDITIDTPQAARERGKRSVNGVIYERQQQTSGEYGRESEVVFTTRPGGTVRGRMKLVPMAEVQSSHNNEGLNPMHFITEAQPKDRTSQDSVAAAELNAQAGTFDPSKVTGDGNAYLETSPTVNTRGEVIQGNGRVNMMKNVYADSTTRQQYLDYLKEHAAEFGLTEEQIDRMADQNPILVNEIDVEDKDAIRLGQYRAQDLESGGEVRLDPQRVMTSLVSTPSALTHFIRKIFAANEGEEDMSVAQLIDRNGADAVKALATDGILNNTETVSMIKDGKLTPEAKNDLAELLKRHLFAGQGQMFVQMFDALPAKVQRALLSTCMRDMRSKNEDRIVEDLREAVRAFYTITQESREFVKAKDKKDAKNAINAWKQQQNLEGGIPNSEKFSTFALELAADFKAYSQNTLTSMFNDFYDKVQGVPTQMSLEFEEAQTGQVETQSAKAKPISKSESIKQVFDIDIKEEDNGNDVQGGSVVDDGSAQGETGEPGGQGEPGSGGQSEEAAGTADGVRGREGSDTPARITEAIIDLIPDSELDSSLKAAAKAQVNGSADTMIGQTAVLIAQEYVRNHPELSQQDSGAEVPSQLGTASATNQEGESGGQSGTQTEPMDEGAVADEAADDGDSTSADTGVTAPVSGEGSDNADGGSQPEPASSTADSGRRRGRRETGSTGRVADSVPGGTGGEGNPVGNTDVADAGEAAATDREDAPEVESVDDILAQIKAVMNEKDTNDMAMALVVPVDINMAKKLIKVAPLVLKLGYAYIRQGMRAVTDWTNQMKASLRSVASDTGLTDDLIDRLIKDAWDTPYEINGEVHTLSEWSTVMSNAELRKELAKSIEEKREAQKKVNNAKVKTVDKQNIEETLPFLLPAQRQDVYEAERQFFSEDHQDRDHAYGVGYMFTNGTGTGKTYTGLGLIRRFVNQGKGRILIVVPSQEKVTDWKNDGKNLGLDIYGLGDDKAAKKEGAKTATEDKGRGVVITTYANMRQNQALLEDQFDLVVYDEAHKLMENKFGSESETTRRHYLLTNRDEKNTYERLKMIHPKGKALIEAEERLEKAKKALRKAGNAAAVFAAQEEQQEAERAVGAAQTAWDAVEPQVREEAKKQMRKTKTLFLSATPFNLELNLEYAEGYIFTYPEIKGYEDDPERGRAEARAAFITEHFPDGFIRRRNPSTGAVSAVRQVKNSARLEEQERAFADWLIQDLQTMTARTLENGYDYSRDFPNLDMKMSTLFNDAVKNLEENPELAAIGGFFPFRDYRTMSVLYETLKVSLLIPRIQGHIKLGRKVVVFHRRVNDNKGFARPPFATGLLRAQAAAMSTKNQRERDQILAAIEEFRTRYGALLTWEMGLDYRLPRIQIASEFGGAPKYSPNELIAMNNMRERVAEIAEQARPSEEELREAGTLIGDVLKTYDEAEETIANINFGEGQELDDDMTDEERERIQGKNEQMWEKARETVLEAARARLEERGIKPLTKKEKQDERVVGYFAGVDTNKQKHKDVETFNDDDSKMKIIVVQEASGKEGISLHDTTGKHMRALISLALPQSPITFIQMEGRIFRVGQKSNAAFEYPLLGLEQELYDFATRFNGRVGTTENLALGSMARNLAESIRRRILEFFGVVNIEGEGTGGLEFDRGGGNAAKTFENALKAWTRRINKETRDGAVDTESTPEPLGFTMVQWLGLGEGESVLEPSAGKGLLGQYIPETVAAKFVETNANNLSALALNTGSVESGSSEAALKNHHIVRGRFEDYSKVNKFNGVVMNPPVNGDWRTPVQHVQKAWLHLRDGGRLVAVIPDTENVNTMMSGWMEANADVIKVAEIKIPHEGGAQKLIVYDKVTRAEMRKEVKAGLVPVVKDFSDMELEDAFYRIHDLNIPKRVVDNVGKAIQRAEAMKSRFTDSPIVQKDGVRIDDGGMAVQLSRKAVRAVGSENGRVYLGWNRLFPLSPDVSSEYIRYSDIAEAETPEKVGEIDWHLRDEDKGLVQDYQEFCRNMAALIRGITGYTDAQLRRHAAGEVDLNNASPVIAGESLTYDQLRAMFEDCNEGRAEYQQIFDKVSRIAKNLGMKISVGSLMERVAGQYSLGENALTIDAEYWNDRKFKNKGRAQTILHELIHAVTVYALYSHDLKNRYYTAVSTVEALEKFSNGIELTAEESDLFEKFSRMSAKDKQMLRSLAGYDRQQIEAQSRLPKGLEEACEELTSLFERLSKSADSSLFQGTYAMTDVYEFIAESESNPTVRQKLEALDLWERVKDGIKKILTYYEAAAEFIASPFNPGYENMKRRNSSSIDVLTKAGYIRKSFLPEVDRIFDKFLDSFSPEIYNQRAGSDVTAGMVYNREIEEEDGTPLLFRLREEEPPKNTGIGYKVFVLKDGKLYPPMVANPDGADTPTGVWLDADAAPVAGKSKTGRNQVKAGGKGTQGGSGTLAYRPGWHLGEIPYALQFNRKNPETGERELFPANFVWAEVEYANDVDYQDEAMSYGYNANGKFQHSYAGLPRVPENGAYRYRTNPNPETDPWIITGAMKVNRLLTPSEVDDMVRAAGREPQPRQEGAITDAEIEQMNAQMGEGVASEGQVYDEVGVGERIPVEQSDISPEDNERMIRFARSRGGRRSAEYTARVIMETIDKLHLGDRVDIVSRETLTGRKARAKGWFDRKTGRITIVIDNHTDMQDVIRTLMHEGVAHFGLRELFGDGFDKFLSNVYIGATDEIRGKINALVKSKGLSVHDATEEYLADLAENMDFSDPGNRGWWLQIKEWFLNMFREMGADLGIYGECISDAELRYTLWRSYQNLANPGRYSTPFTLASSMENDRRMEQRMNGDMVAEEEGGDLFRDGNEVTSAMWDEEMARLDNQTRTIAVDHYTPIRTLQNLLSEKLGIKINGTNNVHEALLNLSSLNMSHMKMFDRLLWTPLEDAAYKLMGKKGRLTRRSPELAELQTYVYAKHAVERNRERAMEKYAEKHREDDPDMMERWYADKENITGDSSLTWRQQQEALDLLLENYGVDYTKTADMGLRQLLNLAEDDDWRTAAYDYVSMYEDVRPEEDVAAFWDALRGVTDYILDKGMESGMNDDGFKDRMHRRWQYYVPLRGFDEELAQEIYNYRDSFPQKNGDPRKHMNERSSQAGDIFGALLSLGYGSIIQGNGNLAKQRLLHLARQAHSGAENLIKVDETWAVPYGEIRNNPDVFAPITGTYQDDDYVEVYPNIDENDTPEQIQAKLQAYRDRLQELKDNGLAEKAVGNGKIPYRTLYRESTKHQVQVREGGRTHVITILGDPSAAEAVNGQLHPKLNRVWRAVIRWMSGNFTSRNPAFAVSNTMRDSQFALNNAWVGEPLPYVIRFIGNQMREAGGIIPLYIRYLKDGSAGTDHAARLFNEFMENGGPIGYTFTESQRDYAEQFRERLSDYAVFRDMTAVDKIREAMRTPNKVWEKTWAAVGVFAEMSELINRFSAYKTSREMGRSVSRSILDAHNISANFSQKGAGTSYEIKGSKPTRAFLRSVAGLTWFGQNFVAFYNAGIQGRYIMYENLIGNMLKGNYGKATKAVLSQVVAPIAGNGVALGFINDFVLPMVYKLMNQALHDLFGGDDDDEAARLLDIPYREALPDYVRRSNICIKLPNGGYFKIPISPDIQPMWALGDMLAGAMNGENVSPDDVITTLIDAVSPLTMQWQRKGMNKLISLAPTPMQPFFDLAVNENYLGYPVYKEDRFNSMRGVPQYRMANESVSPSLVKLSQLLNMWTGGNDILASGYNPETNESGLGDINPAKMQHVLRGAFGGLITTALGLSDFALSALTGTDVDIPVSQTPLISRFYQDAKEESQIERENKAYNKVKYEYENGKKLYRRIEKEYKDAVNSRNTFGILDAIKLASSDEARRQLQMYAALMDKKTIEHITKAEEANEAHPYEWRSDSIRSWKRAVVRFHDTYTPGDEAPRAVSTK